MRALSAANLGFGDEQVEPLRAAVEQLEAMRREYEPGRTITFSRAFHVHVTSALASVYVLLERFAQAERLLEGTLAESQLFDSFDAGQRARGLDRRDDLEAELLLSLALARIGRGMSEQPSDCAEVLEQASADLHRLIELAAARSAPTRYPVSPSLVPRAQLWLAWIELERAPEEAAPWLDQVESALAAAESLDPQRAALPVGPRGAQPAPPREATGRSKRGASCSTGPSTTSVPSGPPSPRAPRASGR